MKIGIFAALIQSIICAFAGLVLLFVYSKPIPTLNDDFQMVRIRDQGIFWLSMAVLVWAFSNAMLLLTPESYRYGVYAKLLFRIFASTINNACLLIAVAFFEYGPQDIKVKNVFIFRKLRSSKAWRNFVIITSCVIILITFSIYLSFFDDVKPSLISLWTFNLFDLLLTLFTLWLLGVSLWKSFVQRNYFWQSRLLLIILAYVFAANTFDAWASSQSNPADSVTALCWLLILTSKILLLLMFFSLIISWSAGVADQLALSVAQLLKSQTRQKTDKELLLENRNKIIFWDRMDDQGVFVGSDWAAVTLVVPDLSLHRQVKLTQIPFLNLLLFAFVLKFDLSHGWIYLKDYDLISRDLDRLVQELSENKRMIKDEPASAQNVSAIQLKQRLFIKGHLRWKLIVPPENIVGLEIPLLKKWIEILDKDEGNIKVTRMMVKRLSSPY